MDALANFAYSTVATAPSPATSGTSVTVQSGDGAKFPTAPFDVLMWPASVQPLTSNAEIARCTAVSTDTFTITRAQYGTTAQSVAVGYQICQPIDKNLLLQGTVSGPTDFGYLGWTVDPRDCRNNSAPTAGRISLTRFTSRVTATCGHLVYYINTPGATLTSGECFIGIYDTGQTTAGVATLLAQSADQHNFWQTNGLGGSAGAATALTSSASLVADGDYFIAVLANGTTMPQFEQGGNTTLLINYNLSGLGLRTALDATTGVTTLPSTITAANIVTTGASGFLAVIAVA